MGKNDVEKAKAFYSHMLENNIVFIGPKLPHGFICYAHTAEDIEVFLRAAEEFF